MIYKKVLLVLFVALNATIFAQVKNHEWQFGVGTSVVKFADKDAAYIGDRYMFQAPRLNLTIPITENFSVDGALSFNTFDIGFIENSAKYFSMDGSVRYIFTGLNENLLPYVFVGGSLVDSERKMTPTINAGAGLNYWFTDTFAVNSQLYYKHSLESFESMRSHIQVSLGVVFALDFQDLFSTGASRSTTGGSCYYNQF